MYIETVIDYSTNQPTQRMWKAISHAAVTARMLFHSCIESRTKLNLYIIYYIFYQIRILKHQRNLICDQLRNVTVVCSVG